jgi:hypothetical protein
LLRKVPVLAEPDGFEVGEYMKWRSFGRDQRRGDLFSYDYGLNFWSPTYKIDGEVMTSVVFTVNPYPDLLAGGWAELSRDSDGPAGGIWVERPRGPDYHGGVVFDKLERSSASFIQVLFTLPGEFPTVPVSRERFLKAEIARSSGPDSEMAAALKKSAYQEWLRGAPARKHERDQAVAMVSATDREKAATLKAALEQTEREVGEQLKASEASERERAGNLATEPSTSQKLRTMLSLMSPAERAEPAILSGTEVGAYEFVPGDTPFARPLVALDLAYARASGSPVAMRAVVVYFAQKGFNEFHNRSAIDQAIYKIYQTLDWEALAALLEPRH